MDGTDRHPAPPDERCSQLDRSSAPVGSTVVFGRLAALQNNPPWSGDRGRGEQVKKRLMLVVVLSFAVACSSQKEPADAAVKGLETAAAAAKPNIEQFAADRMAGVNDAVAAVRAKFDAKDYAGALADVPAASGMVTTAAEAAAARRAQLATDWAAYAGVPATIGLIKSKVAEIDAMRRLPRGMDRAQFDGAKSSLDSATTLWDEATDAHGKGDLVVAVSKATDAKPILDSLMTTLGLSAPM